mgnify:FL=1
MVQKDWELAVLTIYEYVMARRFSFLEECLKMMVFSLRKEGIKCQKTKI